MNTISLSHLILLVKKKPVRTGFSAKYTSFCMPEGKVYLAKKGAPLCEGRPEGKMRGQQLQLLCNDNSADPDSAPQKSDSPAGIPRRPGKQTAGTVAFLGGPPFPLRQLPGFAGGY